MDAAILGIAAMFGGFLLDQRIGDPERLAHPVVAFGKSIAYIENLLNKGEYKFLKGLFTTLLLVLATFFVSHFLLLLCSTISTYLGFFVTLVIVFYCLAGYTLRKEVREVFEALNNSIDEGRKRLSRIVGRDTNQLSPQKIRVAALETLAENLSDGVIAPLFWYALLGAPGMLSYKMINTLDSMIGYKNERYRKYGKFAAKLDDVANYIPARLTALIMLLVTSNIWSTTTVFRNGKNHASPNSGFPEAALASILNCRFGGPNYYSGELITKPYIGTNERLLTDNDLYTALTTNKNSEFAMTVIASILFFVTHYLQSFIQ